MVSVHEATRIVFSNLFPARKKEVGIDAAVGRILAETISADRDFPPFDRVAMDGIAISYKTWRSGRREFRVEGVQAAGEHVRSIKDESNCFEVMTGAVLPNGTDTVIRYEDLRIAEGKAIVADIPVSQGQSVHRKGIDAQAGSLLLDKGILLSPAEIALLASVGKEQILVYDFPKAAIISSGDELVAISDTPADHEIRRSNTYAIEAAMKEIGWSSTMFHLPDNRDVLEDQLRKIITEHEVLILSGGVSKGKFDFIPEVMETLGVKKLFHQVKQRPGKPFWFGASASTTVFALPGNPVSTYMCFYRFIKPWVMKSLGCHVPSLSVILAKDFSFEPQLTYFLQVKVECVDGKLMAFPVAGGGSGDFANLKNVSGFIELPAEKDKFLSGEVYPYTPFRPI